MTTDVATLLIEIGVEELPPLSMRRLGDVLASQLQTALQDVGLGAAQAEVFASPRRLAVKIGKVAARQADREEVLKGPPVRIAFDDEGKPTQALLAFAKKAGCAIDELERVETDKGEWVTATNSVQGAELATLLAGLLPKVASTLPIDRRMRWGTGEFEFVRPVHWLVAMHGEHVLPISLFGQASNNVTYGHRFHAPGPLTVVSADSYPEPLTSEGFVIASQDERKARVQQILNEALSELNGSTPRDDALVEEISALVEWPQAIVGEFDERFLALPREVLISTLKKHQRYFPVADASGALRPVFVTIANVASTDPSVVAEGNQRVVTPRLDDAVFFFDSDKKKALADNLQRLKRVVYERSLGSLHDKTGRVADLATYIADLVGEEATVCKRIATLSRCDLVTEMVGEFPDLQGIMGSYYAEAAGEPSAVVQGLRDFYQPVSATDRLPKLRSGGIVSLAERIDTLTGVFAAGKRPKGNRDPFGLRRAALGAARLIMELGLEIDLAALIGRAVDAQPVGEDRDAIRSAVYDFVLDRLPAYYQDSLDGFSAPVFEAVRSNSVTSLVDFDARIRAVVAFSKDDNAASLAASNKRIGNVLRKAQESANSIDALQNAEPAETALFEIVEKLEPEVDQRCEGRDYVGALSLLASLRTPIDEFFESVMVMSDDPALRAQRLGLLTRVRSLFLRIADVAVMGR